MTTEFLERLYFDWMCDIVGNYHTYSRLLTRLHRIDFVYILPMDENRERDGIDLRYRFAYDENSVDDDFLSERPCSVLEMMVALALRIEEDIAYDPDVGSRTHCWFWDMVHSLGLDGMDDYNYDEDYVDDVVDQFLYREYKRNGEGGLFTIENCPHDLRTVEIWYQMGWYLNDIL